MPSRPLVAFALGWLFAFAGCSHPSAPPTSSVIAPMPVGASPGSPATTVEPPRDVYVLLSGGGTPLSNHYSQYVQAQAIAGWFERVCPPDSTWIFFGTGNRTGEPAQLADVRRDATRDGVAVSSWLPGVLPRNRPATRESFLRALREEILPAVRGGGTLFLFVGDHGELAGKDPQRESAITLWQMKRGRRRSSGWFTDAREILGVAELRKVLAEGLGVGRVVFCMTQCHGGGFHELGAPREIQPPAEWFAGRRAARSGGDAGLRLRVAGYTATDEASPAAGCDPDPNPERWAGYERFLPESLIGIDLLSGEPKGKPALTFAGAHVGATLVDHTIDKPRSTSDHYLAVWADAIEARIATTLQLTSATAEALTAYRRAVDSGNIHARNAALRARQEQFQRFTAALVQQLPESGAVLERGTRKELEAAQTARARSTGRVGRRVSPAELRRAWTDTLRPAWKAAVLAGRVPGLHGAALEFEKHLLALEDEGANLLLRRGDNTALLNEVYWKSGYANPATVDAWTAEEVARWGAARRAEVIAWGRSAASADVRVAAEKIGPGPVIEAGGVRPLSRTTAAERVLFYRRVLAAWEFLLTMNATAALADLQTLIELENSAVPGT